MPQNYLWQKKERQCTCLAEKCSKLSENAMIGERRWFGSEEYPAVLRNVNCGHFLRIAQLRKHYRKMSFRYAKYMYLRQVKNTRMLNLDMLPSQHLPPKVLKTDDHLSMDWGKQDDRPRFDLSVKGWKVKVGLVPVKYKDTRTLILTTDLPPF